MQNMKEWIDSQFDSITLVEGENYRNFELLGAVYGSCITEVFKLTSDDERIEFMKYSFGKYRTLMKQIGTLEQFLEYYNATVIKEKLENSLAIGSDASSDFKTIK